MQLEMEILEDTNYKTILKAEVCPINPIHFTYHLKNQPSDLHCKTIDWFSYDKRPPNRP